MKNLINEYDISRLLFYFFPLLLITGPALPDIALTLISFIFIYNIIKEKNFNILNIFWFKIGIILWIWFIFISFFAENIYLSLIDSLIFIRFLIFILAIHTLIINSEKIRANIINIIFIFVIFITIDCFYQFFNYDPQFGFREDIIGYKPEGLYGRLSGPFKDLVPGSVLTKFFYISLLFFLFPKIKILKDKKISKLILIFILPLIISIIFLSGERIAFASLLLGIFFVIILIKEVRLILLISMIISILTIYTINNLHPIYNDFKIIDSSSNHEGLIIEKEFYCKDNIEVKCKKTIAMQPKFFIVLKDFGNSAYGKIYRTSYEMWKDNKLLGIGLNNFTYLCNNNKKYDQYHKDFSCTTHPHNFYIQALVEAGIIGFILFSILVLSFFITIIKSNQNKIYKCIFLASILVVFWPFMSTGSFLKNWHMACICFLLGICLSSPKSNKY